MKHAGNSAYIWLMVAVITGDVVHSRKLSPALWMQQLKDALSTAGHSPGDWEIFRGDSFQLMLQEPARAFRMAIYLKACIKMLKHVDVRMAIGLGEVEYSGERITESNGTAFVHSGLRFENLKKDKQLLGVQSPDPEFDAEMNLYFRLCGIAMDHWTSKAAEVVKLSLEFPQASQEELGKKLHIQQHAVSKRLKTAYFQEVMEVERRFRERIEKYFG
ncbi:SatD family protein [Thermoflavifilum aggregans]|uniref:SatD family protein n=2 Tax=Thermoflavifilum aggregans TaxID=454188 RepID=A0A2M9CVU0_9BACT|nr:SatD family protein [Thermoflavifilum aggregans]